MRVETTERSSSGYGAVLESCIGLGRINNNLFTSVPFRLTLNVSASGWVLTVSSQVRVDPIFSKESLIYFSNEKKKVIYLNINESMCVHFYIKNKIDIRDTIINCFFCNFIKI